mgnify:FL=1
MAGSAYIGVTGPDTDYALCRDSIERIEREPADALWYGRGTKGYEVRQRHVNRFIESDHEWLLMLDGDMVFAPDTLARLRAHGVAYVSGYYVQRRYQPIVPVWFKPGDAWPPEPFTDEPERGRLHELGGSGWGCVLIHREVIEGTRARVLKGQWDVIEDEMTLWPFDLAVVMSALGAGDIEALRAEIRPLRGQYDRQPVGSDIRYPFLARAAGYTLWGDPDVRPGHVVSYPLDGDDYRLQDAGMRETVARQLAEGTERGRGLWRAHMEAVGLG